MGLGGLLGTLKKYELCIIQAFGILILLVYQLASDIGFQTRKDIDLENRHDNFVTCKYIVVRNVKQ